MNKTAFKDIIREIIVNKSRFFSIMALLFISMVAFSGVFMSTILLEETPEKVYNETNFHDITITSTLGLASQDEFLIGSNLYVEDFEMFKFTDVLVKDSTELVRLENIPERITNLIVKEGRLPEKPSEIVLGYFYFKDKIKIGDTITFVDDKNSEKIEFLKKNEFEVVGFVNSTEYLTTEVRKASTIGSGNLTSFGYILPSVFNMDFYTNAKIRGKGLSDFDSFSSEYNEETEKILNSLKDSFKDRPKERIEELKREANEEIGDAQVELDDAKLELEKAKKDLLEGEAELDDGKRKLLEAEIEIKQGEIDLIEARKKLDEGWNSYNEGRGDLERKEKEARAEIADGKRKLADAKSEIDQGWKDLEAGRAKLEESRPELEKAKADFAKGEKLYNENLKKYEEGKRELDKQKEKIRISEEIRLGNLYANKTKGELEATISSLSQEVEKYTSNISNYNSQIEYNNSILAESEKPDEIQGKINELKALLSSEQSNLQRKTEELEKAKKALSSFNEVEQEGPVSEEVIKYSGEAIEQAELELADGKAKLDEAKVELEEGRSKLQEGIDEFNAGEQKILDSEAKLKEGEAEYSKGLRDLEEGENTLNSEIQKGRDELAQAKSDLDKGEAEYSKGLEDFKEGKIAYEEGKAEYEKGLKKYQDGIKKFEEESKDAQKKIREGEEELDKARKDILKLKEPTFMIDSRNADSSYYTIYGFPGSLKILALVFSTLALLISLLVAFTTMTRMVDERRVLIGSYKGLGYSNSIIAAKFVLFGGVSGITGTIIGSIIGQLVLAPLIYNIYMDGILFSQPLEMISVRLFVIGLLLAIITTSLSAYLSVNKTLKENTASLLRPKTPKIAKRILLEKITPIWFKLSFMNKITARNIFRYKGRMFMTIIGVAVCMSLMILGFGMRYSIANVANLQFVELQKYDLILSIQDSLEEEELSSTIDFIKSDKNLESFSLLDIIQLKLQIPNENTQDVTLFVDMDGNIENIVNFRSSDNKNEQLEINVDGVLITEKLANLMDLKVGSKLNVEIDNKDAELEVAGILENYLGHYIYSSADYIREKSDAKLEVTGIFLNLLDDGEEAVSKTATGLLRDDNIVSSISSKGSEEAMKNTLESLDIIIIIIVLISMLLALVVLYNLTNINVSERIRELSTMKVLGFYPRELTEYVYKETFILSIIGIGLGMGLGVLVVEFILEDFAPLNVMFGDPNYPVSFAISAFFTIIFTILVMFLMHKKLKEINMVEALKSIE